MTERDLKALEKNLHARLVKAADFFSWDDFGNSPPKRWTSPEKVNEIEDEIVETGVQSRRRIFGRKYFGLEASHDLFDLTCLSLDHTLLEKKYKRDFVSVSPIGWGRWHLKSLLSAMTERLSLAAPMAKVPELEASRNRR